LFAVQFAVLDEPAPRDAARESEKIMFFRES
jgi:hypothetical protein